MRTILDEARMWQLDFIVYQDDLKLILLEMFLGTKSEVPDDALPELKPLLRDSFPIEVQNESRRVIVKFAEVVAWQVVDESYTSWDDYEQREDTSVLQELSRSRYLDYIHDNHGWFRDIIGPAKHYRIWTGDEVIDVVSVSKPVLELWEADT